jgi:DNA-directed RNA polymerase specialized sigma24 family protein
MPTVGLATDTFTRFAGDVEPRLRRALVAALGQERGLEATAEALAWAWEHRDRAVGLEHPVGYLFKVGRSRTRYRRIRRPVFDPVPNGELPHVEPGLPGALERLSERQRVAVVLVHAFGWARGEVAEMLGTSVSTLDSHLARGLSKLRNELGVVILDG